MDYQIMSADRVTAEWRDGKLHIVDEAHLPLFLKHFSDLDAWLETRAIDGHRANSRLLKKALRLAHRDDVRPCRQCRDHHRSLLDSSARQRSML